MPRPLVTYSNPMINYSYVEINGQKYRTVTPKTHWDYKYLEKRMKSVRQKIKAYKNGSVGNHYKNYELLLEHLEGLLK